MRFRLIKPVWGKRFLRRNRKDVPNPDFVKEISGPDTIEGDDFSDSFLAKKNEQGYNIYWFPNHSSKGMPEGKWMQGRDVDTYEFVFLDMDLKEKVYASKEAFLDKLKEFPVKPSFVVDSGNGIHAYWRVKNSGPEIHMATCILLARAFQTDASVWTPLQLMRMPGYFNTKIADNFKPCEELEAWDTNEVYDVEVILKALPELTPEEATKIQHHYDKLRGVVSEEFEKDVSKDLPPHFIQVMAQDEFIAALFEKPEQAWGDRSGADQVLANMLVEQHNFDRSDVLAVIYNSQKARSKSEAARRQYAISTTEKACRDRTPFAAPSAKELIDKGDGKNLGKDVRGWAMLDCLESPWRRGQVLGLIAGTGVGKTAFTLKIFKEYISNNDKDNDDIFMFFNLEMTVGEILDRWKTLVGDRPEYYNRLYAVGADHFEALGDDYGPNLQTLYKIVRDTERRTGKKVAAVCIDHLDAMDGDVDIRIEPNFSAHKSKYVDRWLGKTKVILSKDGLCQKFKKFAEKLDVFLIVQSQTTKDKDGGGDVPIEKNAAFGTSRFEWYSDYVIGIWRPLNRIMDRCKAANLYITAFQYTKVRQQKAGKDRVEVNQYQVLKFVPELEEFTDLTSEDKDKFDELIEEAVQIRQIQEKKMSKKYHRLVGSRVQDFVNKRRFRLVKGDLK